MTKKLLRNGKAGIDVKEGEEFNSTEEEAKSFKGKIIRKILIVPNTEDNQNLLVRCS